MIVLSSTLLLIPCCASKNGVTDPGLAPLRTCDLVGHDASRLLEEGREAAFEHPKASLERDSAVRPAVAYYTGNPYKVAGFRERLVDALRGGLHCLIISGGYGLLRPEEPIHRYHAHLSATKRVWRRRIPLVLRDYVARNSITATYGAFSRGYADVVPDDLTGNDRRYIPTFDGETDGGSAMQVVPERVDAAVVELLASGFQAWDGSATAARRATGAKSATFAPNALAPGTGASSAPARSSADIDAVWHRISAAASETFHLKRGKPFAYSVFGNTIDLHTTNRRIPKSDIRRTLAHVPLTSTKVVNDLGVQAPSYVYAILMDPRVRGDAW